MTTEEDDVIDGVSSGAFPRPAPATETSPSVRGAETAATAAASSVLRPANSSLAGIARDLASAPPVDGAKVERLRNAIIAGDYRPDPEAIAAAMLALESVPGRDR